MTASGYADLAAKIAASADWILADFLEAEKIDDEAWSIVQNGLRDALARSAETACGNESSLNALVEGLMLSGFAMQKAQSSRPASGAEHQFSHLWEMEGNFCGLPRAQLTPFCELKTNLEKAGAPTSPEEIGIPRSRLKMSYTRARKIRPRYTILDAAYETGARDPSLDAVFGARGVFLPCAR